MLEILVVDDSLLSRRMISRSLERTLDSEFKLFLAENGAEGVQSYKEIQPDIVFLDLTMPVMDGFEALDKIIEINSDAKVYIISADIQKTAKDKVMASGAVGIMHKPINDEKMTKIFKELLG
ncbi:MAG: response regulator [Spirochaetaceae bacterium]